MTSLETARDTLAGGDDRGGLALLLQAWRELRTPEIADAIDRLSARLDRAAPERAPKKTVAERQESWMERARAAQPQDVSALLRDVLDVPPFAVRDRLPLLQALPEDPRVGTAAARLLASTYKQAGLALNAWRELMGLAVRHADPRVLPLLEESHCTRSGAARGAPFRNAPASRKNLYGKCAYELTKALGGRPQALAEADARALDAIATLLEEDVAVAQQAKSGADGFLLRIAESPDDDGLRQVYADTLLEHGDPRGEFVNLQLARQRGGRPTAAAKAREKELLAANARAWLGPIEPAVLKGDLVFERGFLHSCRLTRPPGAVVGQIVGAREWATARELDLEHWSVAEMVTNPALVSLRVVHGAPAAVLDHAAPLPLERLELVFWRIDAAEVAAKLAGTRIFPALAHLEVRGQAQAGCLTPVWSGSLVTQLETFTLHTRLRDERVLAAILEEGRAAAPPKLARLVLDVPAFKVEVSRGADGRLSDLVAAPGDRASPQALAVLLSGLPDDALTRIRIRWKGFTREAHLAAVARFAGLAAPPELDP